MIGLDTKSVIELEALVTDIRQRIAQHPENSGKERIELGDVEWEIEKRRWRKQA
jgi:hypothetical protein